MGSERDMLVAHCKLYFSPVSLFGDMLPVNGLFSVLTIWVICSRARKCMRKYSLNLARIQTGGGKFWV